MPYYKRITPFLSKDVEVMGWDDLNWLDDVPMGYEEGALLSLNATTLGGCDSLTPFRCPITSRIVL